MINNNLQTSPEDNPYKINVDDIIQEYKIRNIDAFEEYWTGVWKDLASRSDNKYKGMNKITFSQYYELPGIISERLFNVFDQEGIEYINLDNFINGMWILFTKDFDELVSFIFKYYDFDRDGFVTKEDIRIVWSYVPWNKNKKSKHSTQNEDYKNRIESQDELHWLLDKIFYKEDKICEAEFNNIIQNESSDIFLLILLFLLEKRPFNDKTISLLDNLKKSPRIITMHHKIKGNFIASPNLQSIFKTTKTMGSLPGMKRYHTDTINFVKKKKLFNQEGATSNKDKGTSGDDATQAALLLQLAGKNWTKEKSKQINNFKPNVLMKAQESKEGWNDKDEMWNSAGKGKTKYSTDILNLNSITRSKNLSLPKNKKHPNRKDKGLSSETVSKCIEDIPLFPARQYGKSNCSLQWRKHQDKNTLSWSYNSVDNNADVPSDCDDFNENDDSNSLVYDNEDDYVKGNYSGFLYKLSHHKKIKRILFSLVFKDLYWYKSKDDKVHFAMHNWSGVFLKEEPPVTMNGKWFYTFSWISQMKTSKYFCLDKAEYSNWIANLSKAIGYSDWNDWYEIKEKISNAKYGIVKLGINKKTGEKVAIKILSKNNMSAFVLEQVKTEIEIMKIANHPNIVRLYNVYENTLHIYIIMEYLEGGDWFTYIEDQNFMISEKRAAQIIKNLASVIYFLHEFGIIHRDWKPENIQMADRTENSDIKLLDFDLGKILGPNEYCKDAIGTWSYVAPEVLANEPYNKSIDWWAIGVITYLWLSGYLPFDDENDQEIIRKTINEPVAYPREVWDKISVEAKNFVDNLLSKDPLKRMSIKEVLDSEWINIHCTPSSNPDITDDILGVKPKGGIQFRKYSGSLLSFREWINKESMGNNKTINNIQTSTSFDPKSKQELDKKEPIISASNSDPNA